MCQKLRKMKKLYMRPAVRTEEVLMRYLMKETSLPVNDDEDDDDIDDHDGLLVKPEDEYWWPETNGSLWEEAN